MTEAMQTEQKEYVKGEYSGYGSNYGWRIALIAPNGEVLNMETLGHSGSDQSLSYILPDLVTFLEGTTYCGAKLVARDARQMLSLNGLLQWHSFRLSWGEQSPHEEFAYANNGSLDWHLWFCANDNDRVVCEGSLPENWFDIDEDERQFILQQRD